MLDTDVKKIQNMTVANTSLWIVEIFHKLNPLIARLRLYKCTETAGCLVNFTKHLAMVHDNVIRREVVDSEDVTALLEMVEVTITAVTVTASKDSADAAAQFIKEIEHKGKLKENQHSSRSEGGQN
jgi:hypothetical protein